MKRNRRIVSIAVLLCLLVSLFAFTACVTDKHVHDFSNWVCECGEYYTNVDPSKDLFVGNVMQIVVKNLGEQPVSVGSGFVFNKEGWFITNSHVMEDAYYADAYFEIPNAELGETVTRLKIQQVAVNNPNKDIFIGKIDGYEKIASHYRDFDFSTEYQSKDLTFSVGYPNATPFMEINRGSVTSDVPYFPDKLNGVTYIGSTSYFEEGSSGGVLLNEKLQVIGLTTAHIRVGADWVKASVSAFNFINEVSTVPNYELYNLIDVTHGEDKEYINFFNNLKKLGGLTKHVEDDGSVSFRYVSNDEGIIDGNAYTETYEDRYDSGYYMSRTYSIHWSSGASKKVRLFGYWSAERGFRDFVYLMEYKYSRYEYFKLMSSQINYSENLDLTLNNYITECSAGHSISKEEIAYAKEDFNMAYRELTGIFEDISNGTLQRLMR